MLQLIPTLLAALALAACSGPPASVAIDRQPDARLLEPCELPDIPPPVITSKDAPKGWINSTRIALQCGADKAALVFFIQNKGATSAPR